MHSRLAEILSEKRNEVARLKKLMPMGRGDDLPPTRDFKAAISIPNKTGLIAEIKFASPSAGIIREKTDTVSIGRIYEDAGAVAISLITDKRFFNGNLDQLPRLKKAISLPILRKDFIIDEIQIKESFFYGADAVLLIARILSRQQLQEFILMSLELGLAPLTEVHDRDDLDKAVDCEAGIIGINNRDLGTFEVNINTTLDLAPLIPDRCIIVSESGITDEGDIRLLNRMGVQAVLIGSALMKSDDTAKKTGELVDAGYRIRKNDKNQNLRHNKLSGRSNGGQPRGICPGFYLCSQSKAD